MCTCLRRIVGTVGVLEAAKVFGGSEFNITLAYFAHEDDGHYMLAVDPAIAGSLCLGTSLGLNNKMSISNVEATIKTRFEENCGRGFPESDPGVGLANVFSNSFPSPEVVPEVVEEEERFFNHFPTINQAAKSASDPPSNPENQRNSSSVHQVQQPSASSHLNGRGGAYRAWQEDRGDEGEDEEGEEGGEEGGSEPDGPGAKLCTKCKRHIAIPDLTCTTCGRGYCCPECFSPVDQSGLPLPQCACGSIVAFLARQPNVGAARRVERTAAGHGQAPAVGVLLLLIVSSPGVEDAAK